MTNLVKSAVLSETVHTRAPYWQDVPDEEWMDWRWQMSNRLNTADELAKVINLTESENTTMKKGWSQKYSKPTI